MCAFPHVAGFSWLDTLQRRLYCVVSVLVMKAVRNHGLKPLRKWKKIAWDAYCYATLRLYNENNLQMLDKDRTVGCKHMDDGLLNENDA